MPINAHRRPTGVTVLSLVAFAASPGFIILLVGSFYVLHTKSEIPSAAEEPATFLWFCLWMLLLSTCFLTLAWIAFTVGLDLWRLQSRGRSVAWVSMMLFLLLGIIYLLISGIWRLVGVAACAFSIFFLVYLR